MYSIDITSHLDGILNKLLKKNRKQYELIFRKIPQILRNPHRFKNLRSPLQRLKRVHIDQHFVLTFSVDEKSKTVTFEDFDHHDNIYRH